MKFLENLNSGKVLKKKSAPTEKKEDKKVSCNSQIGEGIVSNLGTALGSWGDFVIGDADDKGFYPLTSPSREDIQVYLLVIDPDDANLGNIRIDKSPFSSGTKDADGLSSWLEREMRRNDYLDKRFDDSYASMRDIFESLASLNGAEDLDAAKHGGNYVDDSGLGRRQRMTDEERAEFERTHQRTAEEKERIRREFEAEDEEDLGPIMNPEQIAKVSYVFREALNGALAGSCEDAGMPYNLLSEPEPKKNKQGQVVSIPINGPVSVIHPGYYWSNLSNSKSDNCLKTTLHYKCKADPTREHWIFKCSLHCNFGQTPYVWTFDPDANKEKAMDAKFKTATHLDYTDPEYYEAQEFHTEDLSEKSLKILSRHIGSALMKVIDGYIESPPDRIYELLWMDGHVKVNMIKGLSGKGVINLVKLGLEKLDNGFTGKVLTGDTVLQERPELWKDILKLKSPSGQHRAIDNGRAVWSAAEKAIKADSSIPSHKKDAALANAIRAIVDEGLMPKERAQQLIPDKQKKADEEFVKYKGSGVVKTSVDEWLEKVRNGTYRPGQVYQQNNDTLKPMVEQGLISPKDAYQLNPRILLWMLREHHIGRKEAMSLDPNIRRKHLQDAKRNGNDPKTEWEKLEASRDLNASTYSHPGVFYFEDDYGMASSKAVEAELAKEFEGFDVNVTKSKDNLFKVSIYPPDELEATMDYDDLHDAVSEFLDETFGLFEREGASSGLGLDDDAFGSEDPYTTPNTGREDELGRKWNNDGTIAGAEAGWEDIYQNVLKRERAIRNNSSKDLDSAFLNVGDISIGSNNATEPLNADYQEEAESEQEKLYDIQSAVLKLRSFLLQADADDDIYAYDDVMTNLAWITGTPESEIENVVMGGNTYDFSTPPQIDTGATIRLLVEKLKPEDVSDLYERIDNIEKAHQSRMQKPYVNPDDPEDFDEYAYMEDIYGQYGPPTGELY